jgi:hypothetical protein
MMTSTMWEAQKMYVDEKRHVSVDGSGVVIYLGRQYSQGDGEFAGSR